MFGFIIDAKTICKSITRNEILRKKFGQITDCLFEQIEGSIKQQNVLSNIRDKLLPMLMSGELKVPMEA